MIILFISPPFLSYYLFFWQSISVGVKSERTANGNVSITIIKDRVTYPGYLEFISRSLQVPLNLTNYDVCFKNRSYVEESGKKTFLDADIRLVDDKGDYLEFKLFKNEHICKTLDIDKAIITGTHRIVFKNFPVVATLSLDIAPDERASLSLIDKWVMAIIFTVAGYGLLIIIKDVIFIIYCLIKIIFEKWFSQ